jgi:hypothetical protein
MKRIIDFLKWLFFPDLVPFSKGDLVRIVGDSSFAGAHGVVMSTGHDYAMVSLVNGAYLQMMDLMFVPSELTLIEKYTGRTP